MQLSGATLSTPQRELPHHLDSSPPGCLSSVPTSVKGSGTSEISWTNTPCEETQQSESMCATIQAINTITTASWKQSEAKELANVPADVP